MGCHSLQRCVWRLHFSVKYSGPLCRDKCQNISRKVKKSQGIQSCFGSERRRMFATPVVSFELHLVSGATQCARLSIIPSGNSGVLSNPFRSLKALPSRYLKACRNPSPENTAFAQSIIFAADHFSSIEIKARKLSICAGV